MKIKIILAIWHEGLRGLIESVIHLDPRLLVVKSTDSAVDAWSYLQQNPTIDVLINDMVLSDRNGFGLTKAVKENFPLVSVLNFSLCYSSDYFTTAFAFGADGVVDAGELNQCLIPAIHSVNRGLHYWSFDKLEAIADQNVIQYLDPAEWTFDEQSMYKKLCKGYTLVDIADQYNWTMKDTFERYDRIYEKIYALD